MKANLSKKEFVALMAALMTVDVLAIDIMLPALPQIGDALGVANPNDRSLVFTAFLLGFGLPQLIFGPIADRFGRRGVILGGLLAYCVATIVAVVAPNFAVMLVLRFLQGAAAAAIRVGMMSAVRDRYAGRAMGEVMSIVLSIFLLVPIICPSIGQLLLLVWPWQSIFIFMGITALIFGVWTLVRLPETLAPENRRALNFAVVADGFRIVVTNRRAFLYGIVAAFMYGIIVGMFSTAQQIYVDIYKLGELFPIAFGAMPLIAAVASNIVAMIIRRFGLRRVEPYRDIDHHRRERNVGADQPRRAASAVVLLCGRRAGPTPPIRVAPPTPAAAGRVPGAGCREAGTEGCRALQDSAQQGTARRCQAADGRTTE